MPGSSAAGSPEFKRVVKGQVSPVFVARRISDVKTEYRSTRHGHDRCTDRFGLALPFCVTVVFDPKPSKPAIPHPANQWVPESRSRWTGRTGGTPPRRRRSGSLQKIAKVVQALFLSCEGSEAPHARHDGRTNLLPYLGRTYFCLC